MTAQDTNIANIGDINDDIEDPFIPCEICDEMVRFSEYEAHLRPCSIRSTMFGSDFLMYRDEDTRDVYRIDIGPALMAFQNMNLRGIGSNINLEISNLMTERDLIVAPQIIPILQTMIDPSDTQAINMLISDVIGTVEIGVPDIDLVLNANTQPADDVCPICQDMIEDTKHVKTLCNHSYCDPCIRQWLARHTSCPVCNQDQRDLQQKKEEQKS